MPGERVRTSRNGARAALRGDAVEDEPRGLALLRAPFGAARRDQIRLRAQHDAVVEHLQRRWRRASRRWW